MMKRRRTPSTKFLIRSIVLLALLIGGLATTAAVAGATSAPTITAVNPSSTPAGVVAQAITLMGSGFLPAAIVTSDSGITMSTTFVSTTELDLSATVSDAEAPGTYDVIVTNVDGGTFDCVACLTVTGTSDGSNWPSFLNGNGHDSYNPSATSFTPANTGQLAPAWNWVVPPSPNAGYPSLLASPTVVNGVIYIGAMDGYFYAVSEATHQVLWSEFLATVTSPAACGPGVRGIVATAAVATDPTTGNLTVYVNSPDGYLYALDAATGAIDWKGLIDPSTYPIGDYYSYSSPLVSNGNVYVGISSCDDSGVVGGMVAFSQSDGSTVATWLDQPAGQIGGSMWSSPVLAADGSIIVSTGNGDINTQQPLFDESIVKLDPNTLAVESYWQVPPAEQIRDSDFGSSPTDFSATINGVQTPMVGDCNKNGYYYALNQNDLAAGPVWQYQMTAPYVSGATECDSAAIWNGTDLIEGGGNNTTIGGTAYMGSVQALDPSTGAVIWQTGLNGAIVGSPTEDGAGLVAAPTYAACSPTTIPCVDGPGLSTGLGVYLLSAATGAIAGFVATPQSPLFGQAVFVGNDMILGAGPHIGLTDYEVSQMGPALTRVTPDTLAPGASEEVTITGSGFTSPATVTVSNGGVASGKVKVVSATKLQVKLTALASTSLGAPEISISFAGSPPTVDSCNGCLTIAEPVVNPTVTSLSSNTLPIRTGRQSVTATGIGFEAGLAVDSQDGIAIASTFVSSTQLNLSVKLPKTIGVGSYNVTVKNPDGGKFVCSGCLNVTFPS
jgi:outer membrane protein assembly factor BamB